MVQLYIVRHGCSFWWHVFVCPPELHETGTIRKHWNMATIYAETKHVLEQLSEISDEIFVRYAFRFFNNHPYTVTGGMTVSKQAAVHAVNTFNLSLLRSQPLQMIKVN